MKRFHVHVAVPELGPSIAFYSRLFGQPPSRQEPDYAKWMLDDPRVNFAISSRGHTSGVNHFGMQADSDEELTALRTRAEAAAGDNVLGEGETTCCYASSEKHWTVDPQGLAWEHFRTLSVATVFGSDTISAGESNAASGSACCVPLHASAEDEAAGAPCCIPNSEPEKRGTKVGSCCA